VADEAAKALDDAKAALIALTSHTGNAGAGVKVTRFQKTGAIDYKKVLELKGVDLEKCRGEMREGVHGLDDLHVKACRNILRGASGHHHPHPTRDIEICLVTPP
jgi:hypothetical protein